MSKKRVSTDGRAEQMLSEASSALDRNEKIRKGLEQKLTRADEANERLVAMFNEAMRQMRELLEAGREEEALLRVRAFCKNPPEWLLH